MSALGQKQTLQKSAECPLYPQKWTCAVQVGCPLSANRRTLKSAPIIICRRNGRKLNCYNMACGNRPIRIMGVLGSTGFQCL